LAVPPVVVNVNVPLVAMLMVPIEAPSTATSTSNCAVGLVPISPTDPEKSTGRSKSRAATHLNSSSEAPGGPPE
jgi:hypothetical protein